MRVQAQPPECIYVSASSRDARFTRICVASIRSQYPEAKIRILAGGRLQPGLRRELQTYWDAPVAEYAYEEYGWGFVKLEPLFGAPGERFLMLDSDTVILGNVLSLWVPGRAQFAVDNEAYAENDIPKRFFDWRCIREVDPSSMPPKFVFNSGQWMGTSGVLARADFDPWIEWTFPRRLRHPSLFFPGEQGVFNYVLNSASINRGIRVTQIRLMYWPGRTQSISSNAEKLEGSNGMQVGNPIVIHWAGLKSIRLRTMPACNWLVYFEEYYFGKMPFGSLRRMAASLTDFMGWISAHVVVRVRLRVRRIIQGWHKMSYRNR